MYSKNVNSEQQPQKTFTQVFQHGMTLTKQGVSYMNDLTPYLVAYLTYSTWVFDIDTSVASCLELKINTYEIYFIFCFNL